MSIPMSYYDLNFKVPNENTILNIRNINILTSKNWPKEEEVMIL